VGAVREARKSHGGQLAARRAGRVTNLSIMIQRPAPIKDQTSVSRSLPTVEGDALSLIAGRNLDVSMSLRGTAWRLAEAGLRAVRPELSAAEVQAEVRAQFRRTTG
jgi:hypothetical protein